MNGSTKWEAVHQEGKELVADGLTKPLQGQAFRHFVDLLHLRVATSTPTVPTIGLAGQGHYIGMYDIRVRAWQRRLREG